MAILAILEFNLFSDPIRRKIVTQLNGSLKDFLMVRTVDEHKLWLSVPRLSL